MTLHFLHIGKTGGTAVKRALRRAKLAYWEGKDSAPVPATPFGKIELHRHAFRMADVPRDDFVFFFLRDPIARFVSAFYSRLNEGRPRYEFPWSPEERRAFTAFPTPQRLAAALASDDAEERVLAGWTMRQIRHMGAMRRAVGSPARVLRRLPRIVYIGRQETLSADWAQLKALLGLPDRVRLPRDPVAAHRQDPSLDRRLDDVAVAALRRWYARDYALLEFCELVRARRGWGVGPDRAGSASPRAGWPPLWLAARTPPRLRAR